MDFLKELTNKGLIRLALGNTENDEVELACYEEMFNRGFVLKNDKGYQLAPNWKELAGLPQDWEADKK